MERNVGGIDRTGRLVIGGLLVVAAGLIYVEYIALGAVAAAVALVAGVVLLATGTTQRCPINQAAGIDTYTGGQEG